MNPRFMEKVTAYAANLVIKERDKYISGMKNEFFSFDLSREDLFRAIDDAASFRFENFELKKEIKSLEDQLDRAKEELYATRDIDITLKVENDKLNKKVKGLEVDLARAKGLLNTIYGRSKS